MSTDHGLAVEVGSDLVPARPAASDLEAIVARAAAVIERVRA